MADVFTRLGESTIAEGVPLPKLRYVDAGDGTYSMAVSSGGGGGLADAAVSDPDAASASTNSLLRGILAELQAQTVILEAIETNTAGP